MFSVWSVPHSMTSYNGHLGRYQLNFVSYVDIPEFLNHYFSISVRQRCCYMMFPMAVHHAFEFRNQIQISLTACNLISYCLMFQVM